MIELDQDGSVWVLRMRSGENRFNPEWLDAVNAALDQVAATEGPCALVTTGDAKFYSNGMDLDWLATVPHQAADYLRAIYRLLGRVLSFPAIDRGRRQRPRVRSGLRCWRSRTTSWRCGRTAATGACPKPILACRSRPSTSAC